MKLARLIHLSGVAPLAIAAMTGTASATAFMKTGTVSGSQITVTGTTTGYTLPSPLPFTPLNLGISSSSANGQLPSAGIANPISNPGGEVSSITFSGGVSTANSGLNTSGLYTGNTADVALSPFGGNAGTANPNVPNPAMNYDYLVAQPGGSVTIKYFSTQNSLDLLWGTVDNNADENLLDLSLDLGGVTITGAEIATIITASNFTGDGVLDVVVQITNLGGKGETFNMLTASDKSNNSAFEFDVAAPAPLIGHGLPVLLAAGGVLFGFKLWERSKKRQPLAAA